MLKVKAYSEKSIAVFGDTKPHKTALKKANGRFNPNLKDGDEVVGGWIFAKKKRKEVSALVKEINAAA